MLFKSWQKNAYNFLVAAIIFLTPSNLFYSLTFQEAYVRGVLVDYLIPKLYLSDVFIILFLVLFLPSVLKKMKRTKNTLSSNHKLLVIVLSLSTFMLIGAQVFSAVPLSSTLTLIKVTLLVIFGLVAHIHSHLLSKRLFLITLITTILFQSSVGLIQFAKQQPVYGYLFLGETNIAQPFGIPRAMLFGSEWILPHGTTSHPNVLGGVLSIFMLMILFLMRKTKNTWSRTTRCTCIMTIIIGSIVLFLTQSISAWISFSIGIFFLIYQSKRFAYIHRKIDPTSLALTVAVIFMIATPVATHFLANSFTDNDSLTRRDNLNLAAIEMIKQKPFFGVGISAFTAEIDSDTLNKELVSFLQPVHHVDLLFLSETGVVGVVFFSSLLVLLSRSLTHSKKITKLYQDLALWLAVLSPIAALDHYLISNQTGWLLLFIVSIIVFLRNEERKS